MNEKKREVKAEDEFVLKEEEFILKEPEPIYERNELLASASAFGVKPEVVAGALALAGKEEMTRAEAEAAIKKFLERKV